MFGRFYWDVAQPQRKQVVHSNGDRWNWDVARKKEKILNPIVSQERTSLQIFSLISSSFQFQCVEPIQFSHVEKFHRFPIAVTHRNRVRQAVAKNHQGYSGTSTIHIISHYTSLTCIPFPVMNRHRNHRATPMKRTKSAKHCRGQSPHWNFSIHSISIAHIRASVIRIAIVDTSVHRLDSSKAFANCTANNRASTSHRRISRRRKMWSTAVEVVIVSGTDRAIAKRPITIIHRRRCAKRTISSWSEWITQGSSGSPILIWNFSAEHQIPIRATKRRMTHRFYWNSWRIMCASYFIFRWLF